MSHGLRALAGSAAALLALACGSEAPSGGGGGAGGPANLAPTGAAASPNLMAAGGSSGSGGVAGNGSAAGGASAGDSAAPTQALAGNTGLGSAGNGATTDLPLAGDSSASSAAGTNAGDSSATAGTVGAAGGAIDDGTAGTSMTPDTDVGIDPALIDDFEDGDAVIAEVGDRLGQWSSYNDGTPGAMQSPVAGDSVSGVAPGANGSALAAHTSGSGFADWGAGIQMDFQNPGSGASSRNPYDASAYAGIQFYAKGSGDIRLELATPATTDTAGGGTCSDGCFDTHGRSIELSAEWALVKVPFAALSQEGWGTEAPFTPSALLGLAFKAMVGGGTADFDFWVDELRFATAAELSGVSTDPDTPVEDGAAGQTSMDPVMNEPQDPTSSPGQCNDHGGYNGNGSVTYYYFDQGSAEVNCSYAITGRNPDSVAHIATGNGQYFGAMNTADYNNAATCGACVEVTRDGGRSVVVTIVDQCPIGTNPKCTSGHIDLSTAAFDQVGNRGNEGYVGQGNGGDVGSISWRYVACPLQESISFRLKEPSNANWNQILVQGHTYPIAAVEVNGKAATRQSYNYWEPPNGDMGPEPYEVKVTDVNGGVVTAYVERRDGDIDSGVQLSCQ